MDAPLDAPLAAPAPVVAVRVRPSSAGNPSIVTSAGSDGTTIQVGPLPFAFDHIFDGGADQESVYRAIAQPLVGKAFDGLNSSLLAYGQTSSGKTHSMTGSAADPGITPRLVVDLFEAVSKLPAGATVDVTCSMLEIYNESLVDLLVQSGPASRPSSREKLEIREDPTNGVHVHGLVNAPVSSAADVHALLQRGNAARAVAATNMNATSSRSHMIVAFRIAQSLPIDADTCREVRAVINLVDLAGSERATKSGAEGAALKEGANINRSLSALGMVVNALAEKSRGQRAARPGKPIHVPYRDSKLTRVLQDSLGGNSVTVMLCAVSPNASEREETLNTLHFAERAKAITLKAKRNEITTASASAVAAMAEDAAAAALAAAAARQEARLAKQRKQEARQEARRAQIRAEREALAERQANVPTAASREPRRAVKAESGSRAEALHPGGRPGSRRAGRRGSANERASGQAASQALEQGFSHCQRNFAFGAFDWGSLEEELEGEGDEDRSLDVSESSETKDDPWRTSFGRATVLMEPDADVMGTVAEEGDVAEAPEVVEVEAPEVVEVEEEVEADAEREAEADGEEVEIEVEPEEEEELLESNLDALDQEMEAEAEALAEAEMVASLKFQASFRSHQSEEDRAVLDAFLDEVGDDSGEDDG
jgi:centromeric protein E